MSIENKLLIDSGRTRETAPLRSLRMYSNTTLTVSQVGTSLVYMADYAPESRFFTPDGVIRGSAAIRPFFRKMFDEFAKPGASFQMLWEDVEGDTAYIVRKAETGDNRYDFASDTFVVQNGKIVTQTLAGSLKR